MRLTSLRLAFILPAVALAQTFSPTLPEAIPAVSGEVVDAATLRWIDAFRGEGPEAKPGQQYTAHYTGWLRDGKKFDSSRDRNEPFQFVQGRRHVIAGWEAGFEGMRVGGKRRLFIPYQFAYGEKGNATIPPKAELIFDIELLAVKDVPERPAGEEILSELSGLESKVVALAKALPEEKFDWRPTPDVRSFREILLHIAADNRLLLEVATKQPEGDPLKKMIDQALSAEKQTAGRDQIVQELTETFAAIRKAVEPMRAGSLGRDVKFFGRPTTVRGVLVALEVHAGEHLGQLIAYSRMNGIVPPWSRTSGAQ
ncbi:MAG TPA: DinB family protein [Bryobacteraceae bacterium]|nr:DinB family protein [Bryobacteraceae bacterium]